MTQKGEKTLMLNQRNIMRDAILRIADDLDTGKVQTEEAASRLRDIARMDLSNIEDDEIEMDIDLSLALSRAGTQSGSRPGTSERVEDPVEIALTRVIRTRDRIQGLMIVGDTPGKQDRAAYQDDLALLRDTLAQHHATNSTKG